MNRQTNRVLLHSTQSSSDLTDNKSNQLVFLTLLICFLFGCFTSEKGFFFIYYGTKQINELSY